MAYTPTPGTRPEDLAPNAFSSVGGGAISQQVISDWSLYEPAELTQLFERHYGMAPGFRLSLKTFGFSEGKATPTVGHYEMPWHKELLRVGSIDTAAAGAGNAMIVVLASSMMYDTSVTDGGSARKASYPRVGDLIITPTGERARVTAKDVTEDPHQLTLVPIDSTVDLDTKIVANGEYFIYSNSFGEATDLPAGRTSRVFKYTNRFQIIKESAGASGSELTNRMYIQPIEGQFGSWYLRVTKEAASRFEDACDGALLFGGSSDNSTANSTFLGHDVDVNHTQGMIEFAEDYGYTETYTSGSFSIDDYYDIGKNYEMERVGTKKIIGWQGYDYYTDAEKALQALLNADLTANLMREQFAFDAMPQDEFQPVSPNDFALHIGFKALRVGGYDYVWKQLHNFNEYLGAGYDDYDYSQWSIYTPLGYTQSKGIGGNKPTVGYEYKQLDGYSREMVVSVTAGAGVAGAGGMFNTPLASNGIDATQVGMVSEMAFHGTCANQIIIHKPA